MCPLAYFPHRTYSTGLLIEPLLPTVTCNPIVCLFAPPYPA